MKTLIGTIIIGSLLAMFRFIDIDSGGGYKSITIEDIKAKLDEQKETTQEEKNSMLDAVRDFRATNRDTVIIKVDRPIIQERIIKDTQYIKVPIYKTITRSILIGCDYDHTNNLKIDTTK